MKFWNFGSVRKVQDTPGLGTFVRYDLFIFYIIFAFTVIPFVLLFGTALSAPILIGPRH